MIHKVQMRSFRFQTKEHALLQKNSQVRTTNLVSRPSLVIKQKKRFLIKKVLMRNLIKQFDHFKATSKKGGKV